MMCSFQTKALFSELVLPLEQKLENEFKRIAVSESSGSYDGDIVYNLGLLSYEHVTNWQRDY